MTSPKQLLAEEIARRVKPGETLGIGSGTTVDAALEVIGARAKSERFSLFVVPTSLETAARAASFGFTVLAAESVSTIPWGFDGADEIDQKLSLIKGRGGAFLREKLVAALCKRFVIVADESKLVDRLGAKTAVPVEVLPAARYLAERHLQKLGATKIELRTGSGKCGPVITEQGNIIFDALFPEVTEKLAHEIKQGIGIVESGIFVGFAAEVLVAGPGGLRSLSPR